MKQRYKTLRKRGPHRVPLSRLRGSTAHRSQQMPAQAPQRFGFRVRTLIQSRLWPERRHGVAEIMGAWKVGSWFIMVNGQ